ncbi:hypothetical protein [Streptomyces pinistramenti]|uniref:hypothetical protein n=1 Tax=Streptomyces pinistramenti TaxID=2884812 RepID=UPI001D07D8EB|nr:hypothetical protein [Streptomyces pinistramenti]MCB5906283.1 hypothetical protein [Streptomyces pinistramenti]
MDQALKTLLTLDGHIPETIGRAALSSADRSVADTPVEQRALLDPAASTPDVLVLDATGRTRFVLAGADIPADALLVGSLVADRELIHRISRRYESARAADESASAEMRRWLRELPREDVQDLLDRLAYVVQHMAPVLLYVGDRHYSNFGQFSNLPGRSLNASDDRNLLNRLAATDVTEWSTEDTCFVALTHFLLRSGIQARLEEVNGTQLSPVGVMDFLTDRIRNYGAQPPPSPQNSITASHLAALADTCARERRAQLANGAVFYRLIHGVNLNKSEHLLPQAVTYADVPLAIRTLFAQTAGIPADTPAFDDTGPALDRLAGALHTSPAPAGFHTAYEALLTRFMTTLAQASGSDAAMGRGPRSLAPLHPDNVENGAPLQLRTNDFFCCVAPGEGFARHFADDRATLVKTLSAYSARMRFNTWHYLPHTLNVHERRPGRDDWFFAPSMPDLTHWSDQHHTGHVTFGVRFAIRVPLGIEYAGRYLPGLYDLRLMRARGEQYTVADLRATVAAGRLLGALHQAMSPYGPTVRDFDNGWFRTFYG